VRSPRSVHQGSDARARPRPRYSGRLQPLSRAASPRTRWPRDHMKVSGRSFRTPGGRRERNVRAEICSRDRRARYSSLRPARTAAGPSEGGRKSYW
jgi:hypothetical protein